MVSSGPLFFQERTGASGIAENHDAADFAASQICPGQSLHHP